MSQFWQVIGSFTIMSKYSKAVYSKANQLIDRSFNSIGLGLFKKAVGEDAIDDLIQNPSEEVIFNVWLEGQDGDALYDEFAQERDDDIDIEENYPLNREGFENWLQEQYQNEIETFWTEKGHYPMWMTIFEAKDRWASDKIMDKVDELYELRIGVIKPTDDTLACLFIPSAGYDFFDDHWIPMLELFGWLNVEAIERKEIDKTARKRIAMSEEWLKGLKWLHSKTTNQDIKRHAKGLKTALKAQKLPK